MKHSELIKNCVSAVNNVTAIIKQVAISKQDDVGHMFYDERRMFMMKSKLEVLER